MNEIESDYIKAYTKALMLRNYCNNTIKCYVNVVQLFLAEFKVSPIRINENQIIDYILKFQNSHTKAQKIGALKLFYSDVIKQPLKFKNIHYPRQEAKIPEVLSKEEMAKIYKVIKNKKHKAIFAVMYSTGIRIGELINLKITDIDSNRMLIRIEQGKGNKDRNAPLSQKTLEVLREYFKEYRPKQYLFNGQTIGGAEHLQYSKTSVAQLLKNYTKKAGVKREIHPHLVRHCTFTHAYEAGTDINLIQAIAGHKSNKTTQIYVHISNRNISKMNNPFDNL